MNNYTEKIFKQIFQNISKFVLMFNETLVSIADKTLS